MATMTMESGTAAADTSLIMWMLQDAYAQLAGDVGWLLAALVCGVVGWHLSSWVSERNADKKAQAKQVQKIEAAEADLPEAKAVTPPPAAKATTPPAAKAMTPKAATPPTAKAAKAVTPPAAKAKTPKTTPKSTVKATEKPEPQVAPIAEKPEKPVAPVAEKKAEKKARKLQEKAQEKPQEKVQERVEEKAQEAIPEKAPEPTPEEPVERTPELVEPEVSQPVPQSVSAASVEDGDTSIADGPDIAVTGITEAAHLAQQGNYRAARKQIISTCRLLKNAMCTPAHQESYLLFIERAEKIEEFMREREAQEKAASEAAQAEAAAAERARLMPTQGSPDRLDPCEDDGGWNECWDLVRRAPAWDDSEEAMQWREAHHARPAAVEARPKKEILPAPAVPAPPEPEDENVVALRQKHTNQLAKTELCKFFMWNDCNKGERCMFAHGLDQLKAKPDLSRTSMCQDFLQTGNCTNPNCSFAHSEKTLRFTDGFYKTKMCRFAKSGRCKHGTTCGFAHDESELTPDALEKYRAETAQNAPANAANNTNSGAAAQEAQEGQSKTAQGKQARSHGGHCTTIMVTNIPESFTQESLVSLLEALTPGFCGNFDFFYCPWDPQTECNLGYCIINFLSRSSAAEFEKQWVDKTLVPGAGATGLKILPAALQGRAANLRHFSGFPLAQNQDNRYRPLVRGGAGKPLQPMAANTELDKMQQLQMQNWGMAMADPMWAAAAAWGQPMAAWGMPQNHGWH